MIDFSGDGEEAGEGSSDVSPYYLRIIAVQTLGYTHTEAGYREISDLICEIMEYKNYIERDTKDPLEEIDKEAI